MVDIKNKIVRSGLFLAPLAGISDVSFRRICRAHGAEYAYTEMISAKSLCYEKKTKGEKAALLAKSGKLAFLDADDVPVAVQLFGSEPDYLAEAAAMVEAGSYAGCDRLATPCAIDLNFGCPVGKIVSNGEGSALLKDPQRLEEIVRAVRKRISLPLSVKIRVGWDGEHLNGAEIAKRAEYAGADLIAVHGRTRAQMYGPGVHLDQIRAVKQAVKIPVIGNGDVFSGPDAIRMFRQTGCDGVMIGRGALGNPWIFEQIRAALDEKEMPEPSPGQRIETALAHLEDMLRYKEERVAIPEARKHMAWYTKGMRGAAVLRNELMHATTKEEMVELLMRLGKADRT
ncbi:MAG: tRNA dihydrouridine synthase DusB [Clostridia bacterium]|nr:tRNA dihydrouridine synthase DusB [Clostridia bacterium]